MKIKGLFYIDLCGDTFIDLLKFQILNGKEGKKKSEIFHF